MTKKFTFAIGDIHGRYDLLLNAVAVIQEYLDKQSVDEMATGQVIFLGDYVDRGPDSAAVVEYLVGATTNGNAVYALCGNHEDLMINAYENPETDTWLWTRNGGGETLLSYDPLEVHRDIQKIVPVHHIEWMKSLPKMIQDNHRVYVHAGVNPRKTLEDQSDEDSMWIRDLFLDYRDEYPGGKHVVHGHTPQWTTKHGKHVANVELKKNRTNLDVGAFYTGRLAIGVFDSALPGGPIEVLYASVDSNKEESE